MKYWLIQCFFAVKPLSEVTKNRGVSVSVSMFRSQWPNIRALIQRVLKCSAPAAFQLCASIPAVHSAQIPLPALILHTLSTAEESPLIIFLPAQPTMCGSESNPFELVLLSEPPAFTRSPDKEDVQPWLELSGVSVPRHGGLLRVDPELARCNSNSRAAVFPRRSSSDRRRRWRKNVGWHNTGLLSYCHRRYSQRLS